MSAKHLHCFPVWGALASLLFPLRGLGRLFPLWGLGGFLLCTCGPAPLIAQQNSPSGGRGACFDTNLYRDRQVEPYPILQFLGARCTETTDVPVPPLGTRGLLGAGGPRLFRYFDAHQHYPEYQRLPIDIYFHPAGTPLEEIYHINTGSAAHHITLPMRYEGTYYVVIRDQTKPSVLIVNSVTLEAEFRRSCALTESIIPKYLHH